MSNVKGVKIRIDRRRGKRAANDDWLSTVVMAVVSGVIDALRALPGIIRQVKMMVLTMALIESTIANEYTLFAELSGLINTDFPLKTALFKLLIARNN